jgi:phenylalanyl-tRNA synthetase alpha chain
MHDISALKKAALGAVEQAKSAEELERIRIQYLGRKGELTAILRSLKDMPIEERREVGPKAQALQRELTEAIDRKLAAFSRHHATHAAELPDLTAPGKRFERGHLHPITLVDRDVRRIFASMNFSVVDGPEVESEYYNFDALNIPADNPARDMWDTFWLKEQSPTTDPKKRLLLRTHTSPVQARYMESHTPPFQIIVPGRCFRYEATNAGHGDNFYQFEGLMVGKAVSLANFKFVIEAFFKKFFGDSKIEFRYRPSYFPFVEPGLEMDFKFRGKWFELMGCGMVHPRVFEYAHYNPRDWQGFAFGMGLDRLAMIKYKIPHIRMLYSGDLRFIHQF